MPLKHSKSSDQVEGLSNNGLRPSEERERHQMTLLSKIIALHAVTVMQLIQG